jgi:hypothetical protein
MFPQMGLGKRVGGAGLIEMERVACAGSISLSEPALPGTENIALWSKDLKTLPLAN